MIKEDYIVWLEELLSNEETELRTLKEDDSASAELLESQETVIDYISFILTKAKELE